MIDQFHQHLIRSLLMTVFGPTHGLPVVSVQRLYLSSTAIVYLTDYHGLITNGPVVDPGKAKTYATLQFAEFRRAVDSFFENKTIRMGSKDILAVSIMNHLAHWIQVPGYELCVEHTDGQFSIYGLAGAVGDKVSVIVLQQEDIRDV